MPKTLLLADDSVTIQKVVGITFANEDVELVTVDNGDDALVRARQLKPDLVLADIGMPGLDGYALCREIRKDPNIARTPVLLLTGTFETYDEDKAREVGANGYISKPFEAQALVDQVFAMLAQSQAPPAARPAAPAPAPARPMPEPAAQAAPAPQQRPRPELPPLPGAISAKPARTATPRTAAPFEFDVTPEPSPTAARPAAPLWEAEPELEATDDSPVRRATLESDLPGLPEFSRTPAPDATRLFAPDLLGRPARLPEIPEPPPAPRPARGDFSFEDLDFEEPTGSPANQSQIFGENSDGFGSAHERAALGKPSAENDDEAASPLADPLYSQTRFLDPKAAVRVAPSFDTPNPGLAPPLPDLLGSDEVTEPSHGLDELELSEAEPELEAEPLDEADPFMQPIPARSAAAPDEPDFAMPRRAQAEAAHAAATTRLMLQHDAEESTADDIELEPDMLEAEPIAAEPEPEPLPEPAPPRLPREWSEPDPRPAAPLAARAAAPERARVAPPAIDSALLSQTLEKVAWEAFGSLSEQVVNEVRKRVEAIVWEVVPQMCERLIRDEIARLKAELPE